MILWLYNKSKTNIFALLKLHKVNKDYIKNIFENFNNKNVMIIGDVMIDSYLIGSIDRISPEAPVPIISANNKENRLGGAANVALNIKALEATPIICTVIGNDFYGEIFENLLNKRNITNEGIITSENRKTTSKTRIISQGQHLLRVDDEICANLNNKDEEKLIERIIYILNSKKVDVIIFEDYDKGVITDKIISEVIKLANKKNIITTVDPKKRNFLKYKNVTLFKPNLKELSEGLNINIDKNNINDINKASTLLQKELNSNIIFSTLSENGCFIMDNNENYHIPAEIRKIADVSGAGDTVISVASLCLSLNMNIKDVAFVSNIAGGLVCESVGVVSVNKFDLLTEIIKKLDKK